MPDRRPSRREHGCAVRLAVGLAVGGDLWPSVGTNGFTSAWGAPQSGTAPAR